MEIVGYDQRRPLPDYSVYDQMLRREHLPPSDAEESTSARFLGGIAALHALGGPGHSDHHYQL